LRSAIRARDAERAAIVATHMASLGQSGELDRSTRLQADATVAALNGRVPEALAGFREALGIETRLGQRWEAAVVAVHAVHLLPGEGETRRWAEEARPLLVEMGVTPWIEMLDTALGAAPAAPAPAPTADAQVPAPG
jgi:hypothetical protein